MTPPSLPIDLRGSVDIIDDIGGPCGPPRPFHCGRLLYHVHSLATESSKPKPPKQLMTVYRRETIAHYETKQSAKSVSKRPANTVQTVQTQKKTERPFYTGSVFLHTVYAIHVYTVHTCAKHLTDQDCAQSHSNLAYSCMQKSLAIYTRHVYKRV